MPRTLWLNRHFLVFLTITTNYAKNFVAKLALYKFSKKKKILRIPILSPLCNHHIHLKKKTPTSRIQAELSSGGWLNIKPRRWMRLIQQLRI